MGELSDKLDDVKANTEGKDSFYYRCGNCGEGEVNQPVYDRTKACYNCGFVYSEIGKTGVGRMK